MSNTEQTLSIIKPDATERNLQDEIKKEFKKKGFLIVNEVQLEGKKIIKAIDFKNMNLKNRFFN